MQPIPTFAEICKCLAEVDTPDGKRRVFEYLSTIPFPHFEAAIDHPGYLIRIDVDGKRTLGRFDNREFQAATDPNRT